MSDDKAPRKHSVRPGGGADEAQAWVATAAGSHLRGRRVRDTGPEVALRRAIHALGLRFRLRRTLVGRCRPDILFPGPRVAVFVDGCFWHGCPQHGPSRFKGPNANLWTDKIAANKARDERTTTTLLHAGWKVVRVWECEVRRDADQAAQCVAAVVRAGRSDGGSAAAGRPERAGGAVSGVRFS